MAKKATFNTESKFAQNAKNATQNSSSYLPKASTSLTNKQAPNTPKDSNISKPVYYYRRKNQAAADTKDGPPETIKEAHVNDPINP